MKPLTILFVLLMTCGLAQAGDRDGGKDTGNGGDAYTIEFVALAQSVLKHWDDLDLGKDLLVTKEIFSSAVAKAEVHSTSDRLYVRGFEVDARNYPFCAEKEKILGDHCGAILINRERWDALDGKSLRKIALVFHEYLGVLGMNDQRFDDYYEVTSKGFERLKALLNTQTRVHLEFVCLLETWDQAKGKIGVLETLETGGGKNEKWFELQKQDFVLRISETLEDMLSPTLMNGVRYELYTKNRGELPDYQHPISSARMDFKSVKSSVRISNSPEMQLTCYRAYAGQ